ncbi:MAG TPA: type II toxin-antitoxin system VapC family toxin [Bryobacteraceae bacterium]|jgi:predicted nucleic acid-binding protein|nr:type II toxin-antitoxin system VapC family toxin [Bryobacteraceae bacterium]
MAFVLDASVSACWAFVDEDYPIADAAFSSLQTGEAVVPALWWFEVRNILIVNERRGRIQERETDFFLRMLALFRIRIDREPEDAGVLRMARAQGLSVYDAAYLELAYREKLPLATLDRRLGEAARLIGVQLFEKAT